MRYERTVHPEAVSVDEIKRGYERARREVHELIEAGSTADLARRSDGTRWTNRQLLFHMLFGYLIMRNLLVLVKIVSRLPDRFGDGFAEALDAGTRPFDRMNYWGSRFGGQVLRPAQVARWMDRVIASLQRRLDRENEQSLRRTMRFLGRWDPYFSATMTLRDVYAYPTRHFDHHRRQLTLDARI